MVTLNLPLDALCVHVSPMLYQTYDNEEDTDFADFIGNSCAFGHLPLLAQPKL